MGCLSFSLPPAPPAPSLIRLKKYAFDIHASASKSGSPVLSQHAVWRGFCSTNQSYAARRLGTAEEKAGTGTGGSETPPRQQWRPLWVPGAGLRLGVIAVLTEKH